MRFWPEPYLRRRERRRGLKALALALYGGAALCGARGAAAQDFQLHGFADLRLVGAADDVSWTHGGLSKSRYGDGDGARFGAGALNAIWQVAPAWLLFADVRVQPQAHAGVGLVEAFVRYRPVSTSPWRWSLKAGAFFAPISLENDAVGWTSPWTLTSSAIDTWVGEELRTFGAELRVEHRGETNTFEAAGALFAANDPAGEILYARGWSLGDLVYGVGTHLREADVYAQSIGSPLPRQYDPFLEIDHRLGYYADLGWRSPLGRVTVLYYDNRADPSAYHTFNHGDELYAWRTRFVSAGAATAFGSLTLLGQAMSGTTEIAPAGFRGEAHFAAAYVLAGWDVGAWRPALRVDAFQTRQDPAFPPNVSEHGHALTAALNWRARDWLRLTAEAVRIDSARDQRVLFGEAPRRVDNQLQLNARILF